MGLQVNLPPPSARHVNKIEEKESKPRKFVILFSSRSVIMFTAMASRGVRFFYSYDVESAVEKASVGSCPGVGC